MITSTSQQAWTSHDSLRKRETPFNLYIQRVEGPKGFGSPFRAAQCEAKPWGPGPGAWGVRLPQLKLPGEDPSASTKLQVQYYLGLLAC